MTVKRNAEFMRMSLEKAIEKIATVPAAISLTGTILLRNPKLQKLC